MALNGTRRTFCATQTSWLSRYLLHVMHKQRSSDIGSVSYGSPPPSSLPSPTPFHESSHKNAPHLSRSSAGHCCGCAGVTPPHFFLALVDHSGTVTSIQSMASSVAVWTRVVSADVSWVYAEKRRVQRQGGELP